MGKKSRMGHPFNLQYISKSRNKKKGRMIFKRVYEDKTCPECKGRMIYKKQGFTCTECGIVEE